jgi:hypothetical protein
MKNNKHCLILYVVEKMAAHKLSTTPVREWSAMKKKMLNPSRYIIN